MSIIKKIFTELSKKAMTAEDDLELFIFLKEAETTITKLKQETIDGANRIFAKKYHGEKSEVFGATVVPYTKPSKWEYSEQVSLLELKLKQLKEKERVTNVAVEVDSAGEFDPLFSVKLH